MVVIYVSCFELISQAAQLCYQIARIQPTLFSAPYEVEDPYPSLSDYHDYEPQVRSSMIRIIIKIVFLSTEVSISSSIGIDNHSSLGDGDDGNIYG